MKKTLNQIAFLLIMVGFGLTTIAQTTNYNYYKIKLKKEDLKVAFENTDFGKFVFNFKETRSDHYILSGQAYNKSNEPIGEPFDVSKRFLGGKTQLQNIQLGTFTLTKTLMDNVGMEPNKNYKLTPRKYVNESGTTEDYVSYFVHESGPGNDDENPEYPIRKEILTFKTFMLNPSPPAR